MLPKPTFSKNYLLQFLGPVRVICNDETLQGFESIKALAILGYLAARNTAVTRAELTGLFWGEKPETRARGNLRRVLHNLNQLMPGCLVSDRYTIQILSDRPNCKIDLMLFATLETQDDPAALQTAVALYRGDFMQGLYLDDCPEFENWLIATQERWRQRVAHLLDRLIQRHQGSGAYAQAVEYARQLLTLTPWRESTHRNLMALLARNGQRGEALHQFELCRQMLANEFNALPAPETENLYQRIHSAQARPGYPLPAATDAFIGRKNELAEISQTLATPECRLLTLVGFGGAGKTRLALHYARQNQAAFLDGIAFVPLQTVEDKNGLILALAKALQFPLAAHPSPRQQIFDYLRKKEILLICDNAEQLLTVGTELSDLLYSAPGLKLLVTSRERLGLREEWVYPLEGLPIPGEAANPESAVALFEQRARQVNRRFHLSPEIRQICAHLGGLPLGIELAAALTISLTPPEILTSIQSDLAALESPFHNTPARQRSLQIIYAQSYQSLPQAAQEIFKKLTIFRGGFFFEAAQKITGASLQDINALLNRSLLKKDALGRYSYHPVVAQFAAQSWTQTVTAPDELKTAYSQYFSEFLAARSTGLRGSPQWIEEIEADLENISQAWHWNLAAAQLGGLQQMVDILGEFFYLRCQYKTGEQFFQPAEAQLHGGLKAVTNPNLAQNILEKILRWQGEFIFNRGDFSLAKEKLNESIQLCQESGEAIDYAWSRLVLGTIEMQQSEAAKARTHFEDSLKIFETNQILNGAAICLEFMGTAAAVNGDYENAQKRYTHSLTLYQEVGDHYGSAGGLYCLGDISRITGNYAQAEAYFQQSLHQYQKIANRRGMAQVFNQLGNLKRLAGEIGRAHNFHTQSLELRRDFGERDGIAIALTNLGLDAYENGQYARAQTYCQQGLAQFAEIEHTRGMIFAQIHLGKAQSALAAYADAGQTLLAGLRRAVEIDSQPQALEALYAIASLLAKKGVKSRAIRVLQYPLHHPATFAEVRAQAQTLAISLRAGQLQPPAKFSLTGLLQDIETIRF